MYMTEEEARARHATLKFRKRFRLSTALIVIVLLSMGLWAGIWFAVSWLLP